MQRAWDSERFRTLLDAIIRRTGLTQRGIGERGGFDASRISRWRSGENRPDYDSIRDVLTGLIGEFPEVAEMAPALFDAAGYPGGGTAITDPRPAVVRENWADPDVRQMWALSVSEDQRVSLILELLALKAAADDDDAACGQA